MKSLISLLFSSGLAMVVGVSGVAAGPGGPESAKEACKDGGWALMEEAPAPFKNQGQCVSYFAQLSVTVTPEATATATATPEVTPTVTPTPAVTATATPEATSTPEPTATATTQVASKDECKNGGWATVTASPGPFKNQGQCVSYFARQGTKTPPEATPAATASPTVTPTASPTATPSATATP